MDLKGQIVDTKITIKPSSQLIQYVRNLQYKDGMPENIGKIIKGAECEVPKTAHKIAKINLQLSDDELAVIIELKKGLTKNDDSHKSEWKSEEKDGNKENVSHMPEENIKSKKNTIKNANAEDYDSVSLMVSDVDWLYLYLKELRNCGAKDVPYLHELLEGCKMETPANAVLKRNPELEARCVKLRAQQEAREYRAMTKGVDNVRIRFPEDSISYQLKQLNRQLIAVGQFLLSIFAGFLFGFKGIELMIGGIDFGIRLLLGVMCALIIALAEIYFLAKKLNEEMSVPEMTQLGGPPKFINNLDSPKHNVKTKNKEHQE